jgi:hypothetical protein
MVTPRRPLATPLLVLTALTALAAAGSGCAHPPWNPYKNWQIVRSKHVTAYTSTRIRHAVTMDNLELAYATLRASMFQARPIAPVEVVLLEQPDFRRLLGQFRGSVSLAKLPGKGMYGRRGLVVMYGNDISVSGAAHRMAHLFLHALAPQAPLWLHEGLASYLETAQYRGEGEKAVACLGHLPRKQPEITLDELFSWSWSGYDESKKSSWYRYTASNLIDYLLMGEGGTLRPQLSDFIGEIAQGTQPDAALAKIYPGLSRAALQTKMRAHREASEMTPRGLCPLPFAIAKDKLADEGERRIEPALQDDVERAVLRLELIPRRSGYVDWYPPDMVGLAGAELGHEAVGR